MPTTTPALAGVLPVLQTPFRPDGSIDAGELRREIDWAIGMGAHGLTIGMVSEVLRLATDEQEQLTEIVCEHGDRLGVPVVASCGAESIHTARRLARHAERAGARAVMAIPPLSVSLGEQQLYDYYATLIESTRLGVIVQDASGYVGQPLSIDLQAQLCRTYGERVYFKPEAAPLGPRVSALRDATDGQARIFEGTAGAALVDSYRRGAIGTMPGTETIWAIAALWRALEAGDFDTVYAVNGPLAGLVALQSGLDAFVAVEKHLLVRQGVFSSTTTRGPEGFTLDPETRAEVDVLFDQLARATGRESIPRLETSAANEENRGMDVPSTATR
ncbi:dihydrodipicolinate synthase family protein [Aeromicrobium piscarium]|uniref:Dihydrodipicolinate synthase family protein n=1 Tax=Aeromicrobium piscarium TaxID=2590901 RepID=A0A554RWD8_9ACTN|nr:dihydrodipicolinate synthase family protein [Aeromicrobium piscarium]TSD58418.1 dihydrodipicolinate synthase family protein [Aeromicrobium piscarium]